MIHGVGAGEITPGSLAREREALKWLFSFADMERGVGWNRASDPSEAWKLGRTRALLDLAGAPDRRMRCVLVAGTKGKGSTAASLAALLHASGTRVGLYTQPHLQSYRERIRVDGVMVGAEAFASAVDRWRPIVDAFEARHADAGAPTTFEITTAMAVDLFAREGCAVAVLEVGLGGRLDATNAVDPELSVVTSIGRGHVDILGTRLELIAREKAGIVRAGRPALSARQRPAAARALAAAARERGARLRWVDPLPEGTELALAGAHQLQNAALAVAAANALGYAADVRVLRELRWPCRIEIVGTQPQIVLDGAHDPPSASALAAELRARGLADAELVVGMYRDKEAARVVRPLAGSAARVWVTAPASARAMDPSELARVCRRVARVPVQECSSLSRAIDAARGAAGDRAVVVTGSLGLAGEARGLLGLGPVERLWPSAGISTVAIDRGHAASGATSDGDGAFKGYEREQRRGLDRRTAVRPRERADRPLGPVS